MLTVETQIKEYTRLVRLNNIRNVHFSRNPKIAGLLKDYKYVKEFGEGVVVVLMWKET